MKKTLIIITAFLSLLTTYAQAPEASHLDVLYGYVKTLRTKPDSYKKVWEQMFKDDKWTMMTELRYNCSDPSSLCTWMDDFDHCGLTDICYQIETKRGTITDNASNLFCNGNDPAYSYSIYELSLKANQEFHSYLSYRKNRQHILVVPYDYNSKEKDSKLEIEISHRGKDVDVIPTERGYEFIIENVDQDDLISIYVANTSKENLSFVIINYNSGNR